MRSLSIAEQLFNCEGHCFDVRLKFKQNGKNAWSGMTMTRKFWLGLISTYALIAGCASVPMATPDADAKAKQFVAPTDGMAALYIYRNESFGSAVKLPLLLDNVSVGDTGPHTYVLKSIAPGKHVITSKGEKDVTLDIAPAAGETLFVWQEVKMGAFAARSALHAVDESTGKKAVAECKLLQ
jgi:hypothetical protein